MMAGAAPRGRNAAVEPPEETYETPRAGALESLAAILAPSFGAPPEENLRWLEASPVDDLRVLRAGAETLACLRLIPMGQFFGGRSVPMLGVAGVAVAPEHRGKGAGARLMRAAVRETRERGIALSTLYPAALELYRGVGYERAGALWEVRLSPDSIRLAERELDVRRGGPEDEETVEELYRDCARLAPGHLDRHPYVWERVRGARQKTDTRLYLAEARGEPEGYLYLRQKPVRKGYELIVPDFQARTARAGRRLWTFLADHRSLGREIVWNGSPHGGLFQLLTGTAQKLQLTDTWMLRVVDARAALEARGWPPGLDCTLELELADELLPENAGRLRARIRDGRAEVEPGGSGALRLDVRALGALFGGFSDPEELRRAGLLEGDAVRIEAARAAFAGPQPWMPDFY